MIDNALCAAGTSADKAGADALGQAGVVYDGLKTPGSGAVLAGLVLGAVVTFVLEKRFLAAALGSLIGAVIRAAAQPFTQRRHLLRWRRCTVRPEDSYLSAICPDFPDPRPGCYLPVSQSNTCRNHPNNND